MPLLLAGAALADGLSMLLLPPGGELNPVGHEPPLALALKLGLTLVLLGFAWLPRFRPVRWFRPLILGVGTAAWTFGLLTNLATIYLWSSPR